MQELTNFIHDAGRFISHHKLAIEAAPLQAYCSALIFSPESSVIRQQFSNQMPEWVVVKPELDEWEAHAQTIYVGGPLFHVDYSPDGCYIAISFIQLMDYPTGYVQVYETVSGNFIHEKETDILAMPVYSLNGQLVCCAEDHAIFPSLIILHATTFSFIRRLYFNVSQYLFLPEGNNMLLAFEGEVDVIDWKSGEYVSCLGKITRELHEVALLSATQIVAISTDATKVKIWDLFTTDCTHTLDWDIGRIVSVACSFDGKLIAAASPLEVRLWYLSDMQAWVHKYDLSHPHVVNCLAFSADSRMLISGSGDNLIRIWDETGVCIKVLKGHTQSVMCLTVCQMRNQLASGSEDGTVKLWDLSHILSGQLRQETPPTVQTSDDSSRASESSSYHDEDLLIDSLLFSPTGKMLASISYEETHIWDTVTDICTDILISAGPSGPDGVSFTPDDSLVAMQDINDELGVWDTKLRVQIHVSDLEKSEYVFISEDGRYVSSLPRSNHDRPMVLRIWDLVQDAQAQQPITSETLPSRGIEKHSRFVHSEDRKLLAISDTFEGLRVFERQSDHWVKVEWNDRRLTTTPLAFTPGAEWLLSYEKNPAFFTIEEFTSPYLLVDLGSLEKDAIPSETPKLEEACWRVVTRFGILGIGKPIDFNDTRRIGWGLSLDMDWVMRGNERMLWIPTDYRRIALDVHASRVAFVCPSGQIQIMKFR
jgi:WD40 repeat protein